MNEVVHATVDGCGVARERERERERENDGIELPGARGRQ